MLNYDPLPAEWASKNSTMRFLVENCVRKVFSNFLEISIRCKLDLDAISRPLLRWRVIEISIS